VGNTNYTRCFLAKMFSAVCYPSSEVMGNNNAFIAVALTKFIKETVSFN